MPRSNLCRDKKREGLRFISSQMFAGADMKELSKEEMAQKIGVTARTMDRYHNDISKMQLGDFLELCDMTGLKVSLQWKDDYL